LALEIAQKNILGGIGGGFFAGKYREILGQKILG
jgi:hypothetical protein